MVAGRTKSAREIALLVLHQVEQKGAYANIALDALLDRFGPSRRERALATELVYGTLRMRGALDYVIERFSARRMEQLTSWTRNILRLGAYQMMYLEKIPQAAACDEAVELAKRYGHAGTVRYVNAVLRAMAADPDGRTLPRAPSPESIATRQSHPVWLVKRWIELFGVDEATMLCEANNLVPPVAIRTNTIKTDRARLKELLARDGVRAVESEFVPEGLRVEHGLPLVELESFAQGLFYIQDEASALVSHVVDPQPGEFVIDACSAPGGKATHLAQMMGDRGRIIAADVHQHRLRMVKEAVRRLGMSIIEPVWVDARQLRRSVEGQADRVLVDAPCSALGVIRRRPDVKWRREARTPAELPDLQFEIMHGAAECLKDGGVLVYSTCTLEPAENEEVVGRFLDSHREFAPEDITPFLPGRLRGEPGVKEGRLTVYPHIHDLDGTFIARLRKRGDA